MRWFSAKHLGAVALLASFALPSCAYEPTTPDGFETLEITLLEANLDAITNGINGDGEEIVGSVTLHWEVEGARAIWLSANGESIDLSACTPVAGQASCNRGGTIVLNPDVDTTYRLQATSKSDACVVDESTGEPESPDQCDLEELEIQVKAPATARFEVPGEDTVSGHVVTIPYEVENADTWEIGRIFFDAGSTGFEPCVLESQVRQDDGPFCMLPETAEDPPVGLGEGDVTVYGPTESFTLVVLARNGADDDLGNLDMGDVSIPVTVLSSPILSTFEVLDDTVAPGGMIQIDWSATDAHTLEIDFTPDDVIEVDSATDCGNSRVSHGSGRCDLRVEETAALGEVVVTARVIGAADSYSAPVQDTFTVGDRPGVTFVSDPTVLPDGEGEVALSWTASDADDVRIEDDADPPNLIWTTEDCPDCSRDAGEVELENVDGGTQWTLTATNSYGKTVALAGAEARDVPSIVDVEVDGVSVDDLAVTTIGNAEISWECAHTLATKLESYTISTGSDAECKADADGWQEVGNFSGNPTGTFSITGLSDPQCYRITAIGVSEQTRSQVFAIARRAAIDSFSVSDDSVIAGSTVTLEWDSRFAFERHFVATPSGAVNADSLLRCSTSEQALLFEHCDVTIQVGATGAVSITMEAIGFGQETPTTSDVSLAVGLPPEVTSFEPNPSVLSSPREVDLLWEVEQADLLQIYGPDRDLIHETDNLDEIGIGNHEVHSVAETTTWTLVASSDFAEDSAQATVFFGPSISELTIGTETDPDMEAIDGEATVYTGTAPMAWTGDNGTRSVVEMALANGEDCADVVEAEFAEIFAVDHNDGDRLSTDLTSLERNVCIRLTVLAGSDQSQLLVLVREVPEIVKILTDPDCLNLAQFNAAIDIEMTIRGATEMTLSAAVILGSGNMFLTHTVCTDKEGMVGNLTGSTHQDVVTCVHQARQLLSTCEDCTVTVGDGGGTGVDISPVDWTNAQIRYTLRVTDEEGDVSDAGSDQFDHNVDVIRDGTIGGSGDGGGCGDGG